MRTPARLRVRTLRIRSRQTRKLVDNTACSRGQGGWSLVETLIAILILSLLTAGVMQDLTKVMKVSSDVQNTNLASLIVQEALDSTRNQSWTTLNALPKNTPMTLVVNRTSSQTGPAFCPQPLLMDSSGSAVYNAPTWSNPAKSNSFSSATLTETISNGPAANSLFVTVTCSWTAVAASKSITKSVVISQNGLHR